MIGSRASGQGVLQVRQVVGGVGSERPPRRRWQAGLRGAPRGNFSRVLGFFPLGHVRNPLSVVGGNQIGALSVVGATSMSIF